MRKSAVLGKAAKLTAGPETSWGLVGSAELVLQGLNKPLMQRTGSVKTTHPLPVQIPSWEGGCVQAGGVNPRG